MNPLFSFTTLTMAGINSLCFWGTWGAQSVQQPTLDLSSDLELKV